MILPNRNVGCLGFGFNLFVYCHSGVNRNLKTLINILKTKGLKVATKIIEAKETPFYNAEDYHQDYYEQKGSKPYCHAYIKRF